MRKERRPGGIVLSDTVTALDDGDAGLLAVTGSHGGTSSAAFALAAPCRLVVFNDAGVGKDAAGIAALALLQSAGRAAATVAHTSARIGDALDAYEHGVVSHVNAAAAALGLAPGQRLHAALDAAQPSHEGSGRP
jgi:hypothetical protein